MFDFLTQEQPSRPSAGGGLPGGVPNLGGLADLWATWEGSRQMKDQSGNLKQLYTDALGRRQPYLDKLNESYINPDSFYDSNQWKGLQSVYQNSIDRKAASTGRLANPTDREVLLNNYAMKELENYRQGLRGAADTLNPNYALNPMIAGLEKEARANNPWGAYFGQNQVPSRLGGAGGLQQLAQMFGGMDKIPDYLKKWFGDAGYGNMPGLGDIDLSGAGDSWDFLPQPGGGTSYGNMPGLSVDLPFDGSWDDFDSWDIGSWF